jgi:hypothetical protein
MNELSEKLKRSKDLVICAYDAGGAEFLSSYLIANDISGSFLLSGPALRIFEKKFGYFDEKLISTIPNSSETLLSATGGQTDFEFETMREVLNHGGEVIAILDHWFNYPDRFVRNGERIIPSSILVFDHEAEALAKEQFPGIPIHRSKNYYFEAIKKEYDNLIQQDFNLEIQQDFLYLCEPISRDEFNRKKGFDEYSSLEYFFKVLKSFNLQNSRITIRPHPSDPDGKYESIIPEAFNNVVIEYKATLVENLAKSSVVVGCNTMAMIVALELGKTVLSATPPPATTVFTHKNITPMCDWNP